MDLTVDIGNQYTKLRCFAEGYNIACSADYSNPFPIGKLSDFSHAGRAIISDVGGKGAEIIRFLKESGVKTISMSHKLALPLSLAYKTPETLGVDRIAAAVGAGVLFPDYAMLVIDAGTAITFDFVEPNGVFAGGNISPGIAMRLKSLHHFTANLPLVSINNSVPEIGSTTYEAIAAGVRNSVLFEIEEYISRWCNISRQHKVIVTGGDADFLVNSIKSSIFVNSNLVAIGLKRILELNA